MSILSTIGDLLRAGAIGIAERIGEASGTVSQLIARLIDRYGQDYQAHPNSARRLLDIANQGLSAGQTFQQTGQIPTSQIPVAQGLPGTDNISVRGSATIVGINPATGQPGSTTGYLLVSIDVPLLPGLDDLLARIEQAANARSRDYSESVYADISRSGQTQVTPKIRSIYRRR